MHCTVLLSALRVNVKLPLHSAPPVPLPAAAGSLPSRGEGAVDALPFPAAGGVGEASFRTRKVGFVLVTHIYRTRSRIILSGCRLATYASTSRSDLPLSHAPTS